MKNLLIATGLVASTLGMTTAAQAADYVVDVKGAHAFITFKINHLGYSLVHGRFNTFEGKFNYDKAAPNNSGFEVEIATASVDSNHAERDKHLKGKDFLNVAKYPKASFKSTKVEFSDASHGQVTGDFSLHGVTQSISFPIEKLGEGQDPWGGYRAGFIGSTELKLADYGIDYNLGPASTHVQIELSIEGVRVK